MSKENLYIIIPAYNEEDNIESVATDWCKVIDKIGNNSKLVIINDGSKDKTYEKLKSLSKDMPNLVVLDKENSGHGGTVLYGYKYALDNKASYIFQTDSDGQTVSSEFWEFWNKRHDFNAIIGSRTKRQDGFSRVIVTKTLKAVIYLIFGLNIEDANTPFRLIERDTLKQYYKMIPENFNLSNVMLSILMVDGNKKVKFIPITFKPRQGGVNSINLKKISKIGIQAIKDFRNIKMNLKRNDLQSKEITNEVNSK